MFQIFLEKVVAGKFETEALKLIKFSDLPSQTWSD